MVKIPKTIIFMVVVFIALTVAASGEKPGSFSPRVDSKGNISLPSEVRSTWVHVGSRVLTSTAAIGPYPDQAVPAAGFHDVYIQPVSLQEYKKTGMWPDGAMIVMEVRAVLWDDLPTGHVMSEGELLQLFVMVKDTKGRFPGNPHWGDGWGWALFKPVDTTKNVSTNYKNDCKGCHDLVKTSDRIFIQGYPAVRLD